MVSFPSNEINFYHHYISTACQTVRRPVAYYEHLIDGEKIDFSRLSEKVKPLLLAFHSYGNVASFVLQYRFMHVSFSS